MTFTENPVQVHNTHLRDAFSEGGRSPVRTVVLGEDPLLRLALTSILQEDPAIDVAGDFACLRDVPTRTSTTHAQVLALQASQLHDRFRADYAQLAALAGPKPAIVAVVDLENQTGLRNALLCRATGFVDHNTTQADLCLAVRSAQRGRTYLSPSITESLVLWIADRVKQESFSALEIDHRLTAREVDVLLALGTGLSNAAIANGLHIREATVRSHIYHLRDKLNLNTRTEAVLVGRDYSNTLRFAELA